MKFWTSVVLETATHIDVTFNTTDMHHPEYAYKDVVAKVQCKDINGSLHAVSSINHFAIRPKQFNLSVSSYDPVD